MKSDINTDKILILGHYGTHVHRKIGLNDPTVWSIDSDNTITVSRGSDLVNRNIERHKDWRILSYECEDGADYRIVFPFMEQILKESIPMHPPMVFISKSTGGMYESNVIHPHMWWDQFINKERVPHDLADLLHNKFNSWGIPFGRFERNMLPKGQGWNKSVHRIVDEIILKIYKNDLHHSKDYITPLSLAWSRGMNFFTRPSPV